MNNAHESTYTLLVRSEEKGRGLVETMVYALLGLSVIVSILQFVEQQSRLPMGLTSQTEEVLRVSQHRAEVARAGNPEVL
jgi:hypothetical protein